MQPSVVQFPEVAVVDVLLQGIHDDMDWAREETLGSGSSVWSPFWERSMMGSVEMWRDERGRSTSTIDSFPCFMMAHDADEPVFLASAEEDWSGCEAPLVKTSRSDPYALRMVPASEALLLEASWTTLSPLSGKAVRRKRPPRPRAGTEFPSRISPCGGRWAPYSSARLRRERAQISEIASNGSWICESMVRRMCEKEKLETGGSEETGPDTAMAARGGKAEGRRPGAGIGCDQDGRRLGGRGRGALVELAKAGAEGAEAEEGRKRGFRRARGGGSGGRWMNGGGGRRWPLEEGQSGGGPAPAAEGERGSTNGGSMARLTDEAEWGAEPGELSVWSWSCWLASWAERGQLGEPLGGGGRGLWRVVDDGHACRKVCEEKEEDARREEAERASAATQRRTTGAMRWRAAAMR